MKRRSLEAGVEPRLVEYIVGGTVVGTTLLLTAVQRIMSASLPSMATVARVSVLAG